MQSNSMASHPGRKILTICKFNKELSLTYRGLYGDRHHLDPALVWPGSEVLSDTLHSYMPLSVMVVEVISKSEGGPVRFLQPCISGVAPSSPYEAPSFTVPSCSMPAITRLCLVLWDMPPGHSGEILSSICLAEKG